MDVKTIDFKSKQDQRDVDSPSLSILEFNLEVLVYYQ